MEQIIFKGNRLTTEELGNILNPIKKEEIDKYDRLLNLEGLFKDIEDFYEKFVAYIKTGNSASYDKNYEVVEETVTVKRYHKKVPTLKPVNIDDNIELEEVSDNDIWIDCTADTEGAVSYDYTYTTKTLKEKGSNNTIKYDSLNGNNIFGNELKNIVYLGLSLPNSLKALDKININDTIQCLLGLKDVFIDNPQFSNRVCIMLINCVLESLDETIYLIEQNYKNSSLIDISGFIKALPELKANWVACYNAYEKTKNFGFPGHKKANPDNLDEGYNTSYKDLMKSVGIDIW